MPQNLQHKTIRNTWKKLSFAEQMANIGSEVERALSWREKSNEEYSHRAFLRSMELFNLTVTSADRFPKIKEVNRAKELFADFFIGDNQYHSTKESWQKYFRQFTYLARKNR